MLYFQYIFFSIDPFFYHLYVCLYPIKLTQLWQCIKFFWPNNKCTIYKIFINSKHTCIVMVDTIMMMLAYLFYNHWHIFHSFFFSFFKCVYAHTLSCIIIFVVLFGLLLCVCFSGWMTSIWRLYKFFFFFKLTHI